MKCRTLLTVQTQYGNLLRLMPDDQASPLLIPANEHKRLVVIDFEYANANTPGLEFANHFVSPRKSISRGICTPAESCLLD